MQGLLAAALGLGEEYLGELRGLWVSARPTAPLRHAFQTVNYLFLKEGKLEELRGLYREGRTQIPIQYLLGEEGRPVAFEVYVASERKGIVEGLGEALANPAYPLALGPAYALAWAEGISILEADLRSHWTGTGLGWWEAGKLRLQGTPLGARLYRDRFPLSLGPGRQPMRIGELALEVRGEPLPVQYEGEVLTLGEVAVGVVQV